MEVLKYRKGKISKDYTGRVWLVDRELKETKFQPGSSFNVKIDEVTHQITIVPDGPRKVSHRDNAPVIDIRNLRVKAALELCDYITVAIYNDRIVVKGKKYTSTKKMDEVQQRKTTLKFTRYAKNPCAGLLPVCDMVVSIPDRYAKNDIRKRK